MTLGLIIGIIVGLAIGALVIYIIMKNKTEERFQQGISEGIAQRKREAENLTEEHIKLLRARCGKNTKIFFDGDIHQADSAIFKDRNGLKLLLKLHESAEFAPLFSTVQLITIERSIVAGAADFLDNI